MLISVCSFFEAQLSTVLCAGFIGACMRQNMGKSIYLQKMLEGRTTTVRYYDTLYEALRITITDIAIAFPKPVRGGFQRFKELFLEELRNGGSKPPK